MLEGGLESSRAVRAEARAELVVMGLGRLGRGGSSGGRGQAGQEAEVAEDDSLAQQGGRVGGLHHLLGLGLLTLHLHQ